MSLDLHPVPPADLDAVERLLREADLPVADVRDGDATFHLARRGGEPVAVGGLERVGDAALLRSVAVVPDARGEGLGTALVAALEDRARAEGVETLFLLTTDAGDFFAARGYERVAREAVPAGLRGTPQFASLCPDSATAMRRTLAAEDA